MLIDRKELIKNINTNLIHHLDFHDKHEVDVVDSGKLLSPHRFDVMAKYVYAKHYKNRYDMGWVTEVYREHLRVWGGGVEGDLSGKDDFEKYLSSFNNLLKSVEKNGFSEKKGLLPIGKNGIIVDGAHRAAACLAYNVNPYVVHFDHSEASYSSAFFKGRGLKEIYLDAMAVEYVKLSGATYIVCLFPISLSGKADVERILADYGSIVYEKQVFLNNFGPVNFIAQLYKGEHWVGRREDGWPGALTHAKNKFKDNKPLTVYLFECDDLLLVKEVKTKIRALFDYGNDSVHINDTREEAVRIAEQVFNNNSVHMLNYADLSKTINVHSLHDVFVKDISGNGIDLNTVCIDSSSVLALYGLRESRDLDYLDYFEKGVEFSSDLIGLHNHEVPHYGKSLGDLVFNPNFYLYYDTIKYSSLSTVLEMKRNRGELKDMQDIELAKSIESGNTTVAWRPLGGLIRQRAFWKNIKGVIKKTIPGFLRPTVFKLYNRLSGLRLSYIKLFERLRFDDLKMEYLGYNLVFSPGTSLVDRIRSGRIYEPDVTTAIVRLLKKLDSPTVLDIGCNIGLISLNILRYIPDAKIFAFEPGPHQFKLFSKTVQANSLESFVNVFNLAISDENGEAVFSIHTSKHASGDGFMDTGRAGKTKKITVRQKRLDDWWIEQGRPGIDFIKIDTEGAELKVLRGAGLILEMLRPAILMEISSVNLRVYEYGECDILEYLNSKKYELRTLAGSPITAVNIAYYTGIFTEFIAVYQNGDHNV